ADAWALLHRQVRRRPGPPGSRVRLVGPGAAALPAGELGRRLARALGQVLLGRAEVDPGPAEHLAHPPHVRTSSSGPAGLPMERSCPGHYRSMTSVARVPCGPHIGTAARP